MQTLRRASRRMAASVPRPAATATATASTIPVSMNRENIKDIIRDVFEDHHTQDVGPWVSFRCPLAQWTHEKGRDKSPSAGILVNDNGTSVFNCFVCKHPCPLHVLIERYASYTGEDLDAIIGEVEDEEYLGPSNYAEWERDRFESELLMPLDEAVYMGLYESASRHPYLRGRGISRETAERLELLFDPRDPADGEARILFPVRGVDGHLYGFSGRAIDPSAALKVRDYHGLKKSRLVLGAHLAAEAKAVLAVEGLFDYARSHECGYCGCAVMHANVTADQANVFRDIDKPTYGFFDDDDAGRDGVTALGEQLVEYTPVMRVRWPRRWIEHDFNRKPVKGHWLKDPGELRAQEFDDMIDHARLY